MATKPAAATEAPSSAVPEQGGPCTASSYRLVAVAEGATGNVLLGAEIQPASARPCRLRTTVTLALRDHATGAPLAVPVARVTVAVARDLLDPAGTNPSAVWGQPWCGTGAVDVVVRDDLGHESTAERVVHPRCDPAAGPTGAGPGLSVAR